MAQERRGTRRRILGRFGIRGRVAAGVAAALLIAAVTLVALLTQREGVVIERREPVATEATDAADESGPRGSQPSDGTEREDAENPPASLLVHVDGAVFVPGVYELPAGSRTNDAVLAAGGLCEDADTTSLNLAAELHDGEKVHVPSVGEGSATSDAPLSGSGPAESALININTADVATLDELPGVGESTARAIVEDREAHGPYTSPEDLMRVSGIGEKKFAKLEAMICV